jgi:predicted ATPase
MSLFIKKLHVENFKSISKADIEFKPLTVLVGRNSAGKSSLLHSLLLASQHLSSDFASDHRISLNRNFVNLGSFHEILNRKRPENSEVVVGIETNDTKWQAHLVFDREENGQLRKLSREAIISKIEIELERDKNKSSDLVSFQFETGEILSQHPPLLFSGDFNSSEIEVAIGEGFLSIEKSATSDESQESIARRFDYVMFIPAAGQNFHPVPLERTDFIHYLIDEFYQSALELRNRRSSRLTRLGRKSSILTAKPAQNREYWEENLIPIFKSIFATNIDSFSDFSNSGFLRQLIRKFKMTMEAPVRLVKLLPENRPYKKDENGIQEAISDLVDSIALRDISDIKSALVPFLQQEVFKSDSYECLKPIHFGRENNWKHQDFLGSTKNGLFTFDMRGSILPELEVTQLWGNSRERLSGKMKNVYYLGPIRDTNFSAPRLADPRNLGPKGEQAVEVLAHEAYLRNKYPLPLDDDGFNEHPFSDLYGSGETFSENLNRWLSHFGLAHGVQHEDQGRDRPRINVLVDKDDPTQTVDLRSVGQGMAQVLPVLMQCLLARPDESIVIIEQPELHLHPRLESQLADFFLLCAKQGRQIVVETHSEHLINRLRLRIAEDKSNSVQDMVKILYAEQENDETHFNEALIDSYGGLANEWPRDFLDLNLVASEKLIDAAIDKRLGELEDEENEEDEGEL